MSLVALQKSKKAQNPQHLLRLQQQQPKVSRYLITVTVVGSCGPLRFVVKEEDLVASVIDTALRSYAREGRLPILGSDLNNFLLYCANAGSQALSPGEPIGSYGGRNFVLCKKKAGEEKDASGAAGASGASGVGRKATGEKWKSWLNKSLNLKIASH